MLSECPEGIEARFSSMWVMGSWVSLLVGRVYHILQESGLYVLSWLAIEKMLAERMLVAEEERVWMLLFVSQESGEPLDDAMVVPVVESTLCLPLALLDVVDGRAVDRSSRDHAGLVSSTTSRGLSLGDEGGWLGG